MVFLLVSVLALVLESCFGLVLVLALASLLELILELALALVLVVSAFVVLALVLALVSVLVLVLALVSGLVIVLALASSSLPAAVPRPFKAAVAPRDRERGFPAVERFRRPTDLASPTVSLAAAAAAVANFSEMWHDQAVRGQGVRDAILGGHVRATGEVGGSESIVAIEKK